ncbi:hypothetical protein VTL71DRAFT_8475 [Oculimacula yallundae]|uniref:Uncharacterized protein n=1 Tax=Oculimacula yallundae TaxID=86028 RepID=A0ABR4CXV1_9HELO
MLMGLHYHSHALAPFKFQLRKYTSSSLPSSENFLTTTTTRTSYKHPAIDIFQTQYQLPSPLLPMFSYNTRSSIDYPSNPSLPILPTTNIFPPHNMVKMANTSTFARRYPGYKGKPFEAHLADQGVDPNDVRDDLKYLLKDKITKFGSLPSTEQMQAGGWETRNTTYPPTKKERKLCALGAQIRLPRTKRDISPEFLDPVSPVGSDNAEDDSPPYRPSLPSPSSGSSAPSQPSLPSLSSGTSAPSQPSLPSSSSESSAPAPTVQPKQKRKAPTGELDNSGSNSEAARKNKKTKGTIIVPSSSPEASMGAMSPSSPSSGAVSQQAGPSSPPSGSSASTLSPQAQVSPPTDTRDYLKNYAPGHLGDFNLVEEQYRIQTIEVAGMEKAPSGPRGDKLPSWKWACWILLARSPGGEPLPLKVLYYSICEWIPAFKRGKDQSARSALTNGPFINSHNMWRLQKLGEEKKKSPGGARDPGAYKSKAEAAAKLRDIPGGANHSEESAEEGSFKTAGEAICIEGPGTSNHPNQPLERAL